MYRKFLIVFLSGLSGITFCFLLADHHDAQCLDALDGASRTVIQSLAQGQARACEAVRAVAKTTYLFATNRMFNAWGSLCFKHVASCALKEGKSPT